MNTRHDPPQDGEGPDWQAEYQAYEQQTNKRGRKPAENRVPSIKQAHPKAYRSWQAMLNRCRNVGVRCYPSYGGRGITVCERWNIFAAFLEDMGDTPGPGYTLDRIDNDGNYEPANCRWATNASQSNNKRTSVLLKMNGQTKTITEWAREHGVNPNDAHHRISRCGWPPSLAVSLPPGKGRNEIKMLIEQHRAQS